MGKATTGLRAAVVVAVGALALAACGGSSGGGGSASASGSESGGSASASSSESASGGGAAKGGTIYLLTNDEQYNTLDPTVMYTGEDLALFGATLFRTLTAYKLSSDPKEGTSLVPDMATDLGTATDGGKTWSWTLKDGLTFQDGSALGCKDIAYGVSRAFAQDILAGGPTYAITYLDIPKDKDGASIYKGPYAKDAAGQAAYDKAVSCSADNKTITFKLNQAVPDFNYTVTLAAFTAVPAAQDTGAKYANNPVSSGPYKIQEYKTGKGGKLVMVRNDKWDPASDTYRQALPDTWQTDFGLDPKVIDQRMIQDTGNDTTALSYSIEPESLQTVFVDPSTAQPDFEGRAVTGFDPYVTYRAINVKKVPNLKVRQALAVALDREALRKNAGGDFAGDYADGVIKPNEGLDYAPTGLWDTLLGKPIPPTGDPEYAKQLLTESGVPLPYKFTFDYPQSPTGDKAAALIVEAMKKAGIEAKPNPIESGQYYGVVFDPAKAHEMISAGWGPDWPNASTIIPPLFTPGGGFDLSQYDDPAFNEKVKAASVEPDRNKQALLWQELNTEAMKQVVVIPTLFGLTQRMAGSKVGPNYLWPAYGSWPYAEMGVTQG